MSDKAKLTIGDIISDEELMPEVTALKSFMNKPFVIEDIEKKPGSIPDENGIKRPWYLITAQDLTTGEQIMLSCGATFVVKQLDAVIKTEHLPLEVTCVSAGKGNLLKLL